MQRDHDKILQLFQDYFNGKLGTYFVPPVFFSGIPEVIKPSQYDAKTNSDGKHKAKIKGDTAERVAFESLKKYYEKAGDDVVVVHSHLFLADANEKDFVVFNLSKGYMMIIETKSTAGIGMYQKAKKQIGNGKSRLEELCGAIAEKTQWKFSGVFFALHEGEKPLFVCDCDKNCEIFAIIGEDQIPLKLPLVEKKVAESHAEKWVPIDHVKEFIEYTKQLMFRAQGNPCAPVTLSNIIDMTAKQVQKAGTPEGMFFWTSEQLSLVQAQELKYVYLDAFYSCGKSEALKHQAKYWNEENRKKVEIEKNRVHYLVNKPKDLNQKKMPFTLILEKVFQNTNVLVKETDFKVGMEPLRPFLEKNGIKPNDFVCFDEVICNDYSKDFSNGLEEMANSVAGLWVAIGAKPVIGRYKRPLRNSGFFCPTLNFVLRNPMKVAEEALKISQDGHKNSLERILQNPIDVTRSDRSLILGKVIKISEIQASIQEAVMAAMGTVPVNKFALIFIDTRQVLITDADLTQKIRELFGSRSVPIIFDGSSGCWDSFQKWLLQPISRRNDVIIIGPNHACNGIETNIVVHVYPENCPECDICFEDPVIISRSTAFLAMSMYKCAMPCLHCQQDEHQLQRNLSVISTVHELDQEMVNNETNLDNANVECEEENQPLIEDNESQSQFYQQDEHQLQRNLSVISTVYELDQEMGNNETNLDNGDVECEEENQPLIENNESPGHFWFRLHLLCKKKWKVLLVLLTLVIGTSILIGLFCVPSHIGKYCNILGCSFNTHFNIDSFRM